MYEDTSETINLSFNFKKPSPTSTDGSYIHTFKNAEGKITTQSGIWVETPSRECLVDALGEHINDIVFQNWMSKDGEISNLHATVFASVYEGKYIIMIIGNGGSQDKIPYFIHSWHVTTD